MILTDPEKPRNRGNKKVAILGAGLAGLSAAWRLSQFNGYEIVVIEKEDHTGGLAATIPFGDNRFDLGSHRIHPGYPRESLEFIRTLLKSRLLTRDRDGTLIVNGWTIPYPPSPGGMLRAIGPMNVARFALSRGYGYLRMFCERHHSGEVSYDRYLSGKVGQLAYQSFHAPYARKVYGMNPENISSRAANLRGNSISPFGLQDAMGKSMTSFFHYPANGFGAIADAMLDEAKERGVKVLTGARVFELGEENGMINKISFTSGGAKQILETDEVISTIPVNQLVPSIRPLAPQKITQAAHSLKWRGIRLLQLIIARDKFLKGDTYYFPEGKYIFGRISEPKCFSPIMCSGDNVTTLNVEVIVTKDDPIWKMDHESFLTLVIKDMKKAFPISQSEIAESRSIFLGDVYPVYDLSFRAKLDMVAGWVESFGNLRTIGRGGLFFHGNADHSINLGIKTAEIIASCNPDKAGWKEEDLEHLKVRV